MNFLYTFDSNYLQHAIASMTSICRTNDWDKDLTFYTLVDSLVDGDIKILKSLEKKFSCRVVCIEINGFMSKYMPNFDTKGWNEVIMARLLMNQFLPQDLDRIIYLDGDTIVRNSIEKLWNTDLHQYCLGAVVEPTVSTATKKRLNLVNKPYFNSGVLLVDLNKWRSQNIEERLMTICSKMGDDLIAGDQDALNVIMDGEFCELSPTYNYVNSFYYYPYDMLAKLEKPSVFVNKNEFSQIRLNPSIVHYLGEDRPWRRGNTHRYSADYWSNVHASPFASCAKEEQGWNLYFKAWRIFNLLMAPIPKVRLWMLQALIPTFLKYRASMRIRK